MAIGPENYEATMANLTPKLLWKLRLSAISEVTALNKLWYNNLNYDFECSISLDTLRCSQA
jgi:hypothetical protein